MAEFVIIESHSENDAYEKLKKIGDNIFGFWDYCSCCGERWSEYYIDSYEKPSIFGESVYSINSSFFKERCFIHYLNGKIEEVKFK